MTSKKLPEVFFKTSGTFEKTIGKFFTRFSVKNFNFRFILLHKERIYTDFIRKSREYLYIKFLLSGIMKKILLRKTLF